jgi:hypothetical protein
MYMDTPKLEKLADSGPYYRDMRWYQVAEFHCQDNSPRYSSKVSGK